MTEPAVAALVAHVRHVPVAERERLSGHLAAAGADGLLLETCHRVEFYTLGQSLKGLEAKLPRGAAGDRVTSSTWATACCPRPTQVSCVGSLTSSTRRQAGRRRRGRRRVESFGAILVVDRLGTV